MWSKILDSMVISKAIIFPQVGKKEICHNFQLLGVM
jgi:hypothetical protein